MLYYYWEGLKEQEKRLWQLCLLAGALFLFHFIWFSTWYVEDAAISFSFARNAAMGEGFVGYPGGERVEGFSNPTWTLLLTLGEWFHLSSWVMAKLWGALLGLLGLPLAVRWFQQLRPNRTDMFAALPAFLLALSPQYVMWAASGLENALLSTLIAAASLRLLKEIRQGGLPWSGLIWALVAISRPEAPLYAFVGGMVGGLSLLSTQGWRRVLYWAPRWLAFCGSLFLLWHGWRWVYFAWEFPNTYYAKLDGTERFLPWSWNKQGWKYLRGYALVSGTGFWFWLYVLGQTGLQGWRKWLGFSISLCLFILMIPGLAWVKVIPGWPILAEAQWWAELRIGVLAFAFAILPLIGIGRDGYVARTLAWFLMGTVLFFTLYSGWDWMQGYRWLSFCAIPMAILLSDALAHLMDTTSHWTRVSNWRPTLFVRLPIAIVFTISLITTILYVNRLETSPFDVHRRVFYMKSVQDRLHLEHASLLEVDMGAHMWWSGFELVDMAGLIDVSMGHHKWDKPFIKEYVFEERKPTFAHVHGSWASRTKMRSHIQWKDYLPISPYPTGSRYHHNGNHIRKDLIIQPHWTGPRGREVVFAEGLRLNGWETPSEKAIAGQQVYLKIGMSKTRNQPDFRVVAFLTNGTEIVSLELPPGYDWYPPRRWQRGKEVVLGFHALPLPKDLPVGQYDLGFAIYDRHGARVVVDRPKTTEINNPKVYRNEIRWPNAIEVLPEDEGTSWAEAHIAEALSAIQEGHCEQGQRLWHQARSIVIKDHPWRKNAAVRVSGVLAACYSELALQAISGSTTLSLIQTARRIEHRHPQVIQNGRTIADRFVLKADKAIERGDLDMEYQALRVALTADPTRSWLRKRAEKVRDQRLDIE